MFEDVIKAKVDRRETTYKKLEYQTGYDRSFISRVINRKKKIPLDPTFIEKICLAIGLKATDFPEYRDRVAEKAFKARPDIREHVYKSIMAEEREKKSSA